MDEIVLDAIAKWPNVPAVYGWLSLDRRGRWLIKGERVDNPRITAFFERNYEHDARGCWFFQNGPQRVFVDLEYTPLVLHVTAESTLVTHTNRLVRAISGAWIDEHGVFLVATEHGPALVDDRDIEALATSITDGNATSPDEDTLAAAIEDLQRGCAADLYLRYARDSVALRSIRSEDVPGRLGFNRHPRPAVGVPCDQCSR